MNTLTITQGLQGSGKSTWAKEQSKQKVKVNGVRKHTTCRVNRDDLRQMLFSDICLDPRESQVTIAQEAQVEALLLSGMNVIVDDTNLNPKVVTRWKSIVDKINMRLESTIQIDFQIKSFMDVPLATCIERDAQRTTGRVGRAVIEGTALRLGLIDFSEFPTWVVYDMDGTLADIKWRKPFDYKLVSQDPMRSDIVFELTGDIAAGHGVIILSGRPSDTAGPATDDWLKAKGIPFHHFFQRRAKDIRKDTEIKEEIFKMLPKERIVKVVDDRPVMVRKWNELFAGTNTIIKDVGDGVEF